MGGMYITRHCAIGGLIGDFKPSIFLDVNRMWAHDRAYAYLKSVLYAFYGNELRRLLLFAVSQAFQLALSTLLTVHELNGDEAIQVWAITLFLPAAVAFVHGVLGMYGFFSRCRSYKGIILPDLSSEYNNSDDDDGPLAKAFQSLENIQHVRTEETTEELIATSSPRHDRNHDRRPRVRSFP